MKIEVKVTPFFDKAAFKYFSKIEMILDSEMLRDLQTAHGEENLEKTIGFAVLEAMKNAR